jgi:hypothetical protein
VVIPICHALTNIPSWPLSPVQPPSGPPTSSTFDAVRDITGSKILSRREQNIMLCGSEIDQLLLLCDCQCCTI